MLVRYWRQVSPDTSTPRAWPAAISAAASPQVTCTMYTLASVSSAKRTERPVASASSSSGRVCAWWIGSVWPAASARSTSTSIAQPFSQWTIVSAPRSRVCSRTWKNRSSVTMIAPLYARKTLKLQRPSSTIGSMSASVASSAWVIAMWKP